MALETATYISDLVASNPTGMDNKSTSDDHHRLIKSTLKATFPNITGAVTKTHVQINNLAQAGANTDITSITGNAATATNVAYTGLTGTVPTWNQNTTGNAATATLATTASACSGNSATATNAATATTDAQHFGMAATWIADIRTAGVTYTNASAHPIMLVCVINSSSAACSTSIQFNATGATIPFVYMNALNGPTGSTGSIVIPAGASYKLTDVGVASRTNYLFN